MGESISILTNSLNIFQVANYVGAAAAAAAAAAYW